MALFLNSCAKIARAVWQQDCLLCGGAAADVGLCAPCRQSLPWLPAACCPGCALPTPQGERCGACLRQAPVCTRTEAIFEYAFPVDALIQSFKYAGQLATGRVLGRLALERFDATGVDRLVAMPLHPHRLRERGFNQAVELARPLARARSLAFAPDTCRRVRAAPPQAGLHRDQRTKNVRGAFVVARPVHGQHLAIVDDVLTTGSSVNELARVLLEAGAASVRAWVMAKTLQGHAHA